MEELRLEPVRLSARFEGGVVSVEGRWGSLRVDEPPEIGGSGRHPSPLDLLLASLASCEAFMARMIAGKLGLKLEDVRVEVEGSFELGRGLRECRVVYRLKGVSREEAEKLLDLVRSYCPIYNTLARATRISEEVVVE